MIHSLEGESETFQIWLKKSPLVRWAGGRMGWEGEGEESMPMLGGQEEEEGSWKVDEDESEDSEEELVLHTAVLPNSSAVSPAKDFVNVTIDS